MENISLDRFVDQYRQWISSDRKEEGISSEYAFYLKQKKKRLEEKGLQVTEDYGHVEEEIRGTLNRDHHPYHALIEYREAKHELSYQRNGKTIRRYNEPVTIYGTFLDKDGKEDETIICPGCGHEGKLSDFEQGCPYCGTFFELPKRFPYLTSFYSVPGIVERAKLKTNIRKLTLIVGIISGVLIFIGCQFMDGTVLSNLLMGLFLGAFYGGVFAFVSYMGYSFTLLIKAFSEAGKSLPLLQGVGTKKKMSEKMKAYDPSFSYEYFEGRLIMMLRQIAFAKNREELAVYTGKEDLSFFDDLVDMSYRGACRLMSLKEEDGRLIATVRVFLQDIYADKRIRRYREDFIVTVEKDKDAVELGHDLCKVECRNCGSSFDALHYRNCPHCDTAYELVHDDWVVSSIR